MKIEFEKLNSNVQKFQMVTARGIEPRIFGLKGRRLNHFDYAAILIREKSVFVETSDVRATKVQDFLLPLLKTLLCKLALVATLRNCFYPACLRCYGRGLTADTPYRFFPSDFVETTTYFSVPLCIDFVLRKVARSTT